MQNNNHLVVRDIFQSYCQRDEMFLPDRYVCGSCPYCGAGDQYGDQCEICSATYASTDMQDGKCIICGEKPISKMSEHLFFRLEDFRLFLQEWLVETVDTDIKKKLDEWLRGELKDWCISRDEPYFGFAIPDYKNKYFYVWVDAPLGYISTTKEWCKRHNHDFANIWHNPETEIYLNIGKDIVYFHALFLPAMLKTAGFNLPRRLCVHGMLTAGGEKLSKSRGTFIRARTYLRHLQPEWLRYYFATKINGKSADVDFSFADFQARVNADLVGKITNLASRSAQMLQRKLDNKLGNISSAGRNLVMKAQAHGDIIAAYYEKRDFAKALIEIRDIVSDANAYFNEQKPWELVKESAEATRAVLTDVLNVFRIAAVYLKPVLPIYVAKVEKLFAEQEFTWSSALSVKENCKINAFKPLITRIESKSISDMQNETIEEQQQHAKTNIND